MSRSKRLLNLMFGTAMAAALCTNARAGVAFWDFNDWTNGSGGETNLIYAGDVTSITTETYKQYSEGNGGDTSTNGFLQLTPALDSRNLAVVFPDIDNGAPVKAFKLTMDVRAGNGDEHPADGFSVSYVREGDPALTNVVNNIDPGTGRGIVFGFAGGDDLATAQSPAGSGLPENGSKTGVAISFDAWQGNWLPDTSDNRDREGLTVRVDDKTLAQVGLTEWNGACANTNSLQTGAWLNDGGASYTHLEWCKLVVEKTADNKVYVTWKGRKILNGYQLATYSIHKGRLILAGRTGGNNQYVQFDNIQLETVPGIEPLLTSCTINPDLKGWTVKLDDYAPSLLTSVTQVLWNGTDVTSAVTTNKVGGTTTITYNQAAYLPSASANEVKVTFKTSLDQTLQAIGTATVVNYVTIPAEDAVTGVDKTKPGFMVLPWQSGEQPNTTIYTLEQLLGYHGANEAAIKTPTAIAGPLNFNITPASAGGGDAGNFNNGNGYPDSLFPGIPGGNGLNGSTALKVTTYLEFAAPGAYQMIVNSDDGFLVTEGKNADDWFALKLGEYNGGKGSSDVSFTFVVAAAGIYPVRLVWENGNGEAGNGANLEWIAVKDGVKYLVGDTSATNLSGVKAYYTGAVVPAYVQIVQPYAGSTGVWPTNCGGILMDAGTTVNGGSIKLYLNGAQAPSPVIVKSGAATTVMLTANTTNAASTALFKGGLNTAALVWSDSAGVAHSNAWTFSVVNFATLPLNLWTAPGSGSNPGYRMKVFQAANTNISNGWKNTIQMANQGLEGFYAMNLADTSMMTNSGYTWMQGVDAVVNFAQSESGIVGAAGNFNSTDATFPGLPGLDTATIAAINTQPMNYNAAEFKTYLEFPTAGVYYMAVSSDDGFRVTSAESQTRKSMLSVVAPASIAGDLPAMASMNGFDGVAFGGPLPTTSIVAQAVEADPLIGTDGTTPLNNAAAMVGKIAIIQRGTYGFIVKCKLAQDAGAVAVIIANSAANASYDPGIMGGSDPSITIPCLFVKYSDGMNLINTATTDATSPLVLSIGDDGSVKCGEYQGGKGASDVGFPVIVPQAGVYPFRLAWENGTGDANCEWFTYNMATGDRTLVNDVANGGLKAYITRSPVAPTLSVGKDGAAWKITYTGVLRASSTVDGTYEIVAGASSPYTIPTGAAGAKFYRAGSN